MEIKIEHLSETFKKLSDGVLEEIRFLEIENNELKSELSSLKMSHVTEE